MDSKHIMTCLASPGEAATAGPVFEGFAALSIPALRKARAGPIEALNGARGAGR